MRPPVVPALTLGSAALLMAAALWLDGPLADAAGLAGGVVATAVGAAVAAALVLWRADRGELSPAWALGWAALPWLLSTPSATSFAPFTPPAPVARAHAVQLAVAALGAQLSALLLLACGAALALRAAAGLTGRTPRLGLALAAATGPAAAVLLAGAWRGLSAPDLARFGVVTAVCAVAGALAVAAATVDRARLPAALLSCVAMAGAARGTLDAMRTWPAVDVLRGAIDAYADAAPARWLGWALQVGALCPLLVTLWVGRRGDARGAALLLGIAALAGVHRGAIARAEGGVRAALQPPAEAGFTVRAASEAELPTGSVVLPPRAAAVDLLDRLQRVDSEVVALVVAVPQYVDSGRAAALPMLSPFTNDKPLRGVLVETRAAEATVATARVTADAPVRWPALSAGDVVALSPDGADILSLARAVVEARARQLRPVLLRSAPVAPTGFDELARREARDFLQTTAADLAACVRRELPGRAVAPSSVIVHLRDGHVHGVDPDNVVVGYCVKRAAEAYVFRTPGSHSVELLVELPAGRQAGAPREPPRTERTADAGSDVPMPRSRQAVRDAVRSRLPEVAACGARFAQAGVINVAFTIAADGATAAVRVTDQLAGTAVGTCVRDAVRGWTFPPGEPTPVTFALPLSGGGS